MSIDSVGNFLTIIRNGLMVSKPHVVTLHSKMNFALASILKEEGFIRDVKIVEDQDGRKSLKIFLKYVEGESVIRELTRISTPGLRRYVKCNNIKPIIGNLGVSILTTNRGVVSNRKAQQLSVGGEIICTVW
jgi:small subunit ribosomal protein S8